MHVYEACAYEVYAHEVHAHEVHAREMHAHEVWVKNDLAPTVAATTRQPQQRNIDEEVVNVYTITFLQALTGAIPNVSSKWSPHRFYFQIKFATDRYEALTDGYLRVKGAAGEIQAIVEVKRRLRKDIKASLEMQEAAEMVGWIMGSERQPDPSLVGVRP